jgi:hypothetical protein
MEETIMEVVTLTNNNEPKEPQEEDNTTQLQVDSVSEGGIGNEGYKTEMLRQLTPGRTDSVNQYPRKGLPWQSPLL